MLKPKVPLNYYHFYHKSGQNDNTLCINPHNKMNCVRLSCRHLT